MKNKKKSFLFYYKYIDILISGFAYNAKSIIDVGSSNTQLLENYDWIKNKYCLDISKVYSSNKVNGITANFLTYQPTQKYDFCLCLQVLEHVKDPKAFCAKLFEISNHVLISVPYQWKPGTQGHIHDPVDIEKLESWTNRKPRYHVIVTEPFMSSQRLICYYCPPDYKIGMSEARNFAYSREQKKLAW